MAAAGRACPLSYRLGAARLRAMPSLRARTVFVAGGLYGNLFALRALQSRADREDEQAHVVLNGDFKCGGPPMPCASHGAADHNRSFRGVRVHATLGNVEIEATGPSANAGCGCGYPEYVSDGAVDRSNQIVASLHEAVVASGDDELLGWIQSLPMGMVVEMGDQRRRVGIIHGDPDNLAGWGLAVEVQEPADVMLRSELGCSAEMTPHARIRSWAEVAGVQALLCTHTCLPFFQDIPPTLGDSASQLVVCNNGSAGMPNFSGLKVGLATRVSSNLRRPPDSLYGLSNGGLRYDAIPIHYDEHAWLNQFESHWKEGSAAHVSYFRRIQNGPNFSVAQAARGSVEIYLEG